MIKPYDDGKVIVKTVLVLVFILFIVSYGFYQSKNLIYGPKISLDGSFNSPQVVNDDIIKLSGTAKNIATISLNDRPISVDETGAFDEKVLLFPGYNVIKLFGKDKFGASTEKMIEVIYKI
ncbi:MAG: hypothetical protein WCG97_02055 [bacterium]